LRTQPDRTGQISPGSMMRGLTRTFADLWRNPLAN